jgi:acetyl esterase/lipase
MKKYLTLIIATAATILGQSNQRYTSGVFAESQTHNNAVYVSAPQLNSPYSGESQTTSTNLTLHIFQPKDDTLKKRPMLVCLHGGGFMSGNKEHDDMMEFSKIFARYGYVTATAQYRLGMNAFSNTSAERSVYRAIQDSRALLRYLRENSSTLKISPDHIYVLGSSAGAFIALHNLFMNKESERPPGTYLINKFPPTLDNGPDLGSLDAVGSYLTKSSQANGIVALWGAIKHTDIVDATDNKIPALLIHGTKDSIVPFGLGSPFQLPTLSATYGSQLIDQRLTSLNYPHENYFVDGSGHEFYGVLNGMWNPKPNAYWDIVVAKVKDFLFSIHKPTATFTNTINNGHVAFTNTCTKSIRWLWDFGDGETSTVQNPVHDYKRSGNYTVTLTAFSEIASTNEKKETIAINVTGIETTELPFKTKLYNNYPNPFNPETIITWETAEYGHIQIKLYDILGKEVAILVDEVKEPGKYETKFSGEDYSAGIYFCKMISGKYLKAIKLVLAK